MRAVATPMRSPMAEQTPNACHSIKFFMWYSLRIFVKSNPIFGKATLN